MERHAFGLAEDTHKTFTIYPNLTSLGSLARVIEIVKRSRSL